MNSRRVFLSAALALLALPALSQTPPNLGAGGQRLDLTLLHTNDLHGHVLPHVYAEDGFPGGKGEFTRGGLARIATLARKLKREIKNPTMLIDIGDTATRGPLTNAYEGIADAEAMNAAGYELGVIGNNEFKLKDGYERKDAAGAQAALMQVIRRTSFPWLCANAGGEPGKFFPGVGPFVVREVSGVRVGFLGLTAPRSASYPQIVGWWIGDPVEAAKKWIPVARKECDVLIALTHIGIDDDKKLVAATSGIDAVVGGDSHTFLYKPEIVNNVEGKPVPIVQDGEFGVNLGRFDLHFAKTQTGWTLAKYEYALLPITEKIKEAKDVKAVAERFAGPLQREIVARLPENMIGKTPDERTKLTALATMEGIRRGVGAELGITMPGDGSFNVFRTASLSRYDLYAAWPFKNRVATARLTGAEISALRAKFPALALAPADAALDSGKTYSVAFIDFVATGSLGISAEKLTDTGKDMRDAIAAGWAAFAERKTK